MRQTQIENLLRELKLRVELLEMRLDKAEKKFPMIGKGMNETHKNIEILDEKKQDKPTEVYKKAIPKIPEIKKEVIKDDSKGK